MSTATVAAGTVRPLSAIKADMANALASKPESLMADAKSMLTWLPRKARSAFTRTLQFLHIPQVAGWLRTQFGRFIGVVGKGAFAVEVFTSPWGHATIYNTWKAARWVLHTAVKLSWKIVTSPLRLFSPTKAVVTKVEEQMAKLKLKAAIARKAVADNVYPYISPDNTYMKFTRTTALAVMSVRITRRFVPAGWLRVVFLVVDGIVIARSYGEVLQNTWLGRKLLWEQAVIESDIQRQAETVGAEATRFTREAAAEQVASKRAEADRIEAEGKEAARQAKGQILVKTEDQAAKMRAEADALEQTAARMEAADQDAATEAAVAPEAAAVATAVVDEPKPGPTVPPMGGRTPSSGPAQPPHGSRHGSGGGKGRNR